MSNEILHFGAVTERIVGAGSYQLTMYGFDKVESEALAPLTLSNPNKKEPTRLANFQAQRMILRGEVTEENEWFKVNNITIWVKPLWTQYPE